MTDTHLWQYVAQFFLQWEMFQEKFVQEIKTHFVCSVTFCKKKKKIAPFMR